MEQVKQYVVADGLIDLGVKGGTFVRLDDYAALQQKLDTVLAENVALNLGKTYFAYSPDYGFDYFKNKQDAIDTAEAEIAAYREDISDGWDDDVERVSWGLVIQSAQGFDAQGLHTSDSRHTYQTCEYRLEDEVKTPATDAILNEVRAEAQREFCQNFERYGKVEPYHFNPYFADLYAKISKRIYDGILDNPDVHDMSSLVDWLEQGAADSRAYADMAIEHAAQLRAGSTEGATND